MITICSASSQNSSMMGNALHVHVHARIFISKGATGKCMIGAECLENRSALLSVDSATLPPSGTETQCRQAVFHYHHLQAVDFLPQRRGGWGGDTDRQHICSPGSDFYRHFHGILKICPAFAVVIVGCGRFFIHCRIMDVFALVSHFQLMDDSCGIHSLHHLQKLHLFFFPPARPLNKALIK